jgi:hypothetical protein
MESVTKNPTARPEERETLGKSTAFAQGDEAGQALASSLLLGDRPGDRHGDERSDAAGEGDGEGFRPVTGRNKKKGKKKKTPGGVGKQLDASLETAAGGQGSKPSVEQHADQTKV